MFNDKIKLYINYCFMRNTKYLDNKRPEDDKIGTLQKDKNGREYRIVNGKKIYQIEEKTQHDKDINKIINRFRVPGYY